MDPPDAFLENYTRGAPHPRKFCRRQSRLAMLRMFPLPQSICQTLFYLLRRRRCRRAQSAFCNLATAISVYSLDTCECVLLRSRAAGRTAAREREKAGKRRRVGEGEEGATTEEEALRVTVRGEVPLRCGPPRFRRAGRGSAGSAGSASTIFLLECSCPVANRP